MNIACVSASRIPSSTANSIQVMKACQALQQLGHEVKLWVPSLAAELSTFPSSRLAAEGDRAGRDAVEGHTVLDWENLSALYGLQTRFEVESIPANPRFHRYDFSLKAALKAKSVKADLLYVWPLQAAVFGLGLNIPVAIELHGPPEGRFGLVLYRLLRRLPGKRRLLPITNALAKILGRQDRKPVREGEIVIVSNGVDLERYQGLPDAVSARARLGMDEIFTVGYTGHFYSGRGMGLLLELARHFPYVQFLWVGGQDADVETWKQRLAQQGISNVRMPGFVENQTLPLYQAAADILLMPYDQEIAGSSGGNSAEYCSPMKMFEYMACGRATISSDLPVIREVLNDANCIFCSPGDVESWVRALNVLIKDPDVRKRLGSQAQKDILAYTWMNRAQRALAGFP